MRGKRGDIELQFNWIFVFIVGTLILALAAGFVVKQKSNSDTIISNQIIRFTRSVLFISSATPGKAESQPLQKEIGVSCDLDGCSENGCTSTFYVKPRTLKASINTRTGSIFSPTTIKGDSLTTWSMEWDMPYHINNFLYTTSNQARYIFVEGPQYQEIIDELYSELPDIMGKKEKIEISEIEDIKNTNNYKVRLVFVGNNNPPLPTALSSMNANDISAINIVPSQGTDFGTIEFYKKSGSNFAKEFSAESIYYLGKPTLYGAIFSENREMYNCNMYKAYLRQKIVSELYLAKLETLKASDKITNQACQISYQESQTKIQANIALLEAVVISRALAQDQAQAIKTNSDAIAVENNKLKLKSCPMIY